MKEQNNTVPSVMERHKFEINKVEMDSEFVKTEMIKVEEEIKAVLDGMTIDKSKLFYFFK